MSAIEINKLVGAVLVAGLIFMGINVGVDEIFHEEATEVTVFPVPAAEKKAAAEEQAMAATEETAAATTPEAAPAQPELKLAGLLAAADPENGAKIVRKCTSCHSFDRGGRNKVGPNLWGIVGATKASKEGFHYSDAIAGLGGEWGYDELFAFLARPKDFAPGTKMTFAGVKDPADRADLLAFLRTLSDDPPPLP